MIIKEDYARIKKGSLFVDDCTTRPLMENALLFKPVVKT
jgi:hypothetical protein